MNYRHAEYDMTRDDDSSTTGSGRLVPLTELQFIPEKRVGFYTPHNGERQLILQEVQGSSPRESWSTKHTFLREKPTHRAMYKNQDKAHIPARNLEAQRRSKAWSYFHIGQIHILCTLKELRWSMKVSVRRWAPVRTENPSMPTSCASPHYCLAKAEASPGFYQKQKWRLS